MTSQEAKRIIKQVREDVRRGMSGTGELLSREDLIEISLFLADYKCESCRKPKRRGVLQVHHLNEKGYEEDNWIGNQQVLCVSCHHREEPGRHGLSSEKCFLPGRQLCNVCGGMTRWQSTSPHRKPYCENYGVHQYLPEADELDVFWNHPKRKGKCLR